MFQRLDGATDLHREHLAVDLRRRAEEQALFSRRKGAERAQDTVLDRRGEAWIRWHEGRQATRSEAKEGVAWLSAMEATATASEPPVVGAVTPGRKSVV